MCREISVKFFSLVLNEQSRFLVETNDSQRRSKNNEEMSNYVIPSLVGLIWMPVFVVH